MKRNLYFVIALAVGMGATGFCGYLLYSALGENTAASDQYTTSKNSLEGLQRKSPYPDEKNIAVAQADERRVREFLGEFRKCFSSFPKPPAMDARHFKEYLQKSINEFALQATNAGVGLPQDEEGYAFSFQSQMKKLENPAEDIAPWMEQMEEIKAILDVLFAAKINNLDRIRRPAVSTDDTGSDDYIPLGTVTNQWGSVTPYKVDFRGFSAELAAVLAGFAHSSNCFIVKTVYVSPSRVPLPQAASAESEPLQPAPQIINRGSIPYSTAYPHPRDLRGGREDFPERRLRYQTQPAPVVMAPAPPAMPTTILRETPLFITMYIDVVKLKAPETPPAAVKSKTKMAER